MRAVARVVAALALGAVAALASGGASGGVVRTGGQTPPNVILLMTDDQTVESMRVLGSVKRLLADRGATFANSFVGYSLCCPSRATALTGQYAHNHGVMGNRPPEGGYAKLDHANTLAVWLQQAGYATVHLGKYLNGYEPTAGVPAGWSEWHGSVGRTTYRYYGFTLNEDGKLVTYGADAASYQTDVYARKAVEIIERRARSTQPFFLWVSFLAPHSAGADMLRRPPQPAPRHAGRYAAELLPASAAFDEEDLSDKPAQLGRRPRLTPPTIEAITRAYRLQLESLLAVDEAVERIVEALRRTGELDETLIVFTSDNGFMHGQHRIPQGKVTLYEPSIRVPLIMRGPEIPAGVTLPQPVSNVDLAPTILDVANARPGRIVDGRSLVPLFADPTLHWGRDLLVEAGGRGAFAAIRTPRFLYAEHADGARELYDLAVDPDQVDSRHSDPAYDAVRAELAGRLQTLRACSGSECRRGPVLSFAVRYSGSCLRRSARASIGGRDERLLERVDFQVDGKRVASDEKAPFEHVLPKASLGVGRSVVRALAVLIDGRRVTYERTVPACA